MITAAWRSKKRSESLDYIRNQHRGVDYLWRDLHYRLHKDHVWVFERTRILHRVTLITVYPHLPLLEMQVERAMIFHHTDNLY